jgi:hypothetical protein
MMFSSNISAHIQAQLAFINTRIKFTFKVAMDMLYPCDEGEL